MKEKILQVWKRLECAIQMTGNNITSFAQHIGLSDCQMLLDIKEGRAQLDKELALRINQCFPDYSVAWLMSGESSAKIFEKIPVIKLPLYKSTSLSDMPPIGAVVGELVLSAAEAHGAEFAVRYKAEGRGLAFRDSILLVRYNQGKISDGTLCIAALPRGSRLRIVMQNPVRSESIHLVFPDSDRRADVDELLRRNIRGLWPVVGAVCAF